MKLVTFSTDSRAQSVGVLIDNESRILDLPAAEEGAGMEPLGWYDSMLALIEHAPESVSRVQALMQAPLESACVATGACVLHAPLPVPPSIRDFICFEGHLERCILNEFKNLARHEKRSDIDGAVEEARRRGDLDVPRVFYDLPLYYKGNRFSVVGNDQDIAWPSYSRLMDYECELACVIGKQARDITPETALSHIFGFTIFNDFSARDAQAQEFPGGMGPSLGKDFDMGNVFGPCLVTLDEIGDPNNLEMITRINGKERSRGSSSGMIWKFEELIAFLSRGQTLYPGEIIGSGTVTGGCGLETDTYLDDGDVVELEIEHIGVLRNRVLASQHDESH